MPSQEPQAMGHVHMSPLPQTRKWRQIIKLVASGASAARLATAILEAAERGFAGAAHDHGVLETYWLLVRLPLAARATDFPAALRDCGLAVSDAPDLLDIAVAFTQAIDARMANNRGRTDLGEMAQNAGAEAINAIAGPRAQSLFGSGTDEAREALAALATPHQIGTLARLFFSRFSFKCLDYFLSKAVPSEVGEGKRFRTLAEQTKFTDALRTHCHEASECESAYAGDWFSLRRFESAGDITRSETRGFLEHAMPKLIDEFRKREGTGAS
jgi:hypothetical protein